MSIDTGISVPLFNVFKYFVISFFLEAIVRASLDNIQNFFGALDLHHGCPVSLHRSRIDRYNMSSIVRVRSLPRHLVTLLLACCAYGIEILLEFSSFAQDGRFAISGRLDLYQPTHRACTPLQLENNNTMHLLFDLARSCVTLTEEEYTFYNVTWQRLEGSAPTPLCIHTRNNILRKGDRIYNSIRYSNGSIEEKSLIGFRISLIANSYRPNYNRTRYAVLRLTNTDVQYTSSHERDGRKFTRAVLLNHVKNTKVRCVSTVFGRHGDGFMSLRVYGCFQDIPGGKNYFHMAGTSIIEADAEFVSSKPWSTLSNVGYGTAIFNFTKDVVDDDDMESIQAFTMLLSAASAKETSSVNKYAVVYKHCSDYLVPQHKDTWRSLDFDKADSKAKITVYVTTWALIILVVWPILLSSTSIGFYLWGQTKKLPMTTRGEGDIGRRWLSRSIEKNCSLSLQSPAKQKQHSSLIRGKWFKWFKQPHDVFLNVQVGETEDEIVVGPVALNVDRNVSARFKTVN